MTALAQGMAGLALVMSFALLCVRQVQAASILLVVQCAAVAVSAVTLAPSGPQSLLAIAPVMLAAGVWFAPRYVGLFQVGLGDPRTLSVGGAKPAIAAAGVLAVLCQSQNGLALPLTVILLAILLAATRRHRWMQVMALVGLQNGIVLAASLMRPVNPILVAACFGLPVPLAVRLLVRRHVDMPGGSPPPGAVAIPEGPAGPMPAGEDRPPVRFFWLAWLDLGLSLVVMAATLLVPLDPTASVFAPLLGLDGVMRSWRRRDRSGLSAQTRALGLLSGLFLVAGVCVANPIAAWFAVLGVIGVSVRRRRWDAAVLGLLGAGVVLFGLVTAGGVGAFSLFAGIAVIAAVVPDLAAVLAILLLRLVTHTPWTQAANTLGVIIALGGLIVCAVLLAVQARPARVALLQLSQTSIAILCLSLGTEAGRFAALILLVLLILSRSAARLAGQPLAMAALAGVPPLGVFPGLVLAGLAVAAQTPWLLLPAGAAVIPIVLAGVRHGQGGFRLVPSVAYFPLAVALFAGYLAPDRLVAWLHLVTASHS